MIVFQFNLFFPLNNSWLVVFHNFSSGLRDAVARLFEGEEQATVVTTNYRKDGSRFKNLLTMGPIRNDHGKLTHFVAILKNIGDIKEGKQ